MEKFEELAEEGFEIAEKFWKAVKDIQVNTIVYLLMSVFAFVGWLSRHLTKRAGDEGDSAPLQAESTPEHLPIGEGRTQRPPFATNENR